MTESCLSDEQIAAYIDERLSKEEVKEVEKHLDVCERCLILLAETTQDMAFGEIEWKRNFNNDF